MKYSSEIKTIVLLYLHITKYYNKNLITFCWYMWPDLLQLELVLFWCWYGKNRWLLLLYWWWWWWIALRWWACDAVCKLCNWLWWCPLWLGDDPDPFVVDAVVDAVLLTMFRWWALCDLLGNDNKCCCDCDWWWRRAFGCVWVPIVDPSVAKTVSSPVELVVQTDMIRQRLTRPVIVQLKRVPLY